MVDFRAHPTQRHGSVGRDWRRHDAQVSGEPINDRARVGKRTECILKRTCGLDAGRGRASTQAFAETSDVG